MKHQLAELVKHELILVNFFMRVMQILNGIVTKGNSWQPENGKKFIFFTNLKPKYIVSYIKYELLIHKTLGLGLTIPEITIMISSVRST